MGRRRNRNRSTKNDAGGLDIMRVDAAPLNRLLNVIESLPGEKILTLVINDGRVIEMPVDASGHYGESGIISKSLFSAKLVTAMYVGGGMTIRQITPLSKEVDCPVHGKQMKPICNIYGVAFGENQLMVIPAEEVEWAHTHDADTGKPIEREPNVRFLTLAVPEPVEADESNAWRH